MYIQALQRALVILQGEDVEKRYLIQRLVRGTPERIMDFQTWDSPKVSKIVFLLFLLAIYFYDFIKYFLNFQKRLGVLPLTFFPLKTFSFINKNLTIWFFYEKITRS